jgi:hypothetical protein
LDLPDYKQTPSPWNYPFSPLRFEKSKKEKSSPSTDEDGALAGSTQFCKLLHDEFHLIFETNDGYASTTNGKVERVHQTYNNMTRTSIYTMQAILPANYLPSDLPLTQFWCLALTYVAFIKRRLINSTKNPPIF